MKTLSWKVDSDIEKVMVNHFLASFQGNNPISFIYLDYYETTDIVHFAINLSLNKYYKWYGDERISAVSEISPESNLSPALASYNTQMHMVFKGAHSNDLCQAVFNGSEWTGNVKISSISGISPESGVSPALAVFRDKLYMVFKGAHSNDLCQAVFDGNEWTGNVSISSISDISPQSDSSPALTAFSDNLYLVYKGANSSDTYQAVFDGSGWMGDVKLSDISDISPASDHRPSLSALDEKLFMVYKGSGSNDIYESIMEAVKFG